MNTWTLSGTQITNLRVYGSIGATQTVRVAHTIKDPFLYEVFAAGSVLITDLRTLTTVEQRCFSPSEQLQWVTVLHDCIAFLTHSTNIGSASLHLLLLQGAQSTVKTLARNAPLSATIGANNERDKLYLLQSPPGESSVFDSEGKLLAQTDISALKPSAEHTFSATTPSSEPPSSTLGTFDGYIVRRNHSVLELVHPTDPSVHARRSDAIAMTSVAITDDGKTMVIVEDYYRARIIDTTTFETEREFTFDTPARVMRFCMGERSIAFALGEENESTVALWTRGVNDSELHTIYHWDSSAHPADQAEPSVVEINETATRLLLQYPSQRGHFTCLDLATQEELNVSSEPMLTTTVQFHGNDAVTKYFGMQTTVIQPLTPDARVELNSALLTRWMVFNVRATREAATQLPAPQFDRWAKGSRWRDITALAASPRLVVVAARPALIGVYALQVGQGLDLIEGSGVLARVLQVAVAKNANRFVVALDSGQLLVCDYGEEDSLALATAKRP